ncbi:MAG: aminotransferase class V-fold PLP-dependent enzyme [Gemmatimonadales bacterium]|nr:MAG: aminotransferase class V-fold PLP-dependent enzyme [Gemmatimonadales bacterium]
MTLSSVCPFLGMAVILNLVRRHGAGKPARGRRDLLTRSAKERWMILETPPTGVNVPPEPGDPEDATPLSLSPEAMRELGYRAVDALVERWSTLDEGRPWNGASRSELDERLGAAVPAPEQGEGAAAALDAALTRILPVAARVDHPRFLAYIPSAPTWPSVLADFLAAGFNIFQGTWQGASGPGHVEVEVLEWFRSWVGMPAGTSGLFTSGGSAANALALVAARESALRRVADAESPFRPAVYFSDQAHSSLLRAARAAGIDADGIRILETGPDLRLDPDAVRRALTADLAAGFTPALVAASAGATNTGTIDPLGALADLCAEFDVHYHVDAAYGGFAVLDEGGRKALDGIGRADSVTLDPHKWLFQPFECGCLLVRDPTLLTRVFRVTPEYLQDTVQGEGEVNFGERGIQLTRSFRALKVWMSVRSFGLGAFRSAVTAGIELARASEERIRASAELEVVTPASLGIVVWQARTDADPEALNRRIQEVLAGEGTALLSSTRIHGRHALRLCILNPRLRRSDIEEIVARAEAVVREAGE